MSTILVIDDDKKLQAKYRRELESAGHEVVTSYGTSGLETMRESKPALVIMETKFENSNGLVLMREMLSRCRWLPVIINSDCASYRGDFSSWLAEAYLLKSDDTQELKRTVHEVLERRGNGPGATRRAAGPRQCLDQNPRV